MMRCARCTRPILKPAGTIPETHTLCEKHYGPKCWAKLKGKTARIRKVQPVAVDQPGLWDGCYFTAAGERDRLELAWKQA